MRCSKLSELAEACLLYRIWDPIFGPPSVETTPLRESGGLAAFLARPNGYCISSSVSEWPGLRCTTVSCIHAAPKGLQSCALEETLRTPLRRGVSPPAL